jgi:peptidoglycan/LPS O-acetylase OafA/YrhL
MGTDALVYIHPIARWFEFALGMCTAVAYRRLSDHTRWSAGIGTALELAVGLLTAFVMYRTAQWASALGVHPIVGMPGSVWLIHGPLAAPAFALLIIVLGLGRGVISRVLSLRFLVLLGEIRYALYLLHIPVLRVFWTKFPGVCNSSESWIYPCPWLLLLTLSHLFWRAIERPVRSKLVHLWPIPRERTPETARRPEPVPRSTAQRWLVPAAEVLLVGSLFATFALAESRLS